MDHLSSISYVKKRREEHPTKTAAAKLIVFLMNRTQLSPRRCCSREGYSWLFLGTILAMEQELHSNPCKRDRERNNVTDSLRPHCLIPLQGSQRERERCHLAASERRPGSGQRERRQVQQFLALGWQGS